MPTKLIGIHRCSSAYPYIGIVLALMCASAVGHGARPSEIADAGLRQAFEGAVYSIEDSGGGAYRGVNAAQHMAIQFDGDEARLKHPDGGVNFRLTGYAYGDRRRKPARAKLAANGPRIEYRRGE